ncbi:MAG: F0F1 ATP synthase subunit alpha [Labilithrix sp.]|nr:F0F1 ATP synthase subunit alpha [Labilithrix sp.]MCW5830923.1 F0F1 ATP synthase subunit alpha [Labilithrix sp.]
MDERTDLDAAVRAVRAAIERATESFVPSVLEREEGRVVHAADGVLRIAGLPSASIDEVLDVGSESHALVLGLTSRAVQAVALDAAASIREGDPARLTGRVASIDVGDPLLGRVIDPLGRPLDGHPVHGELVTVPIERRPPSIDRRTAVHAPLHTGTLAVDAMLPIGRGQRELIVGDEGTGKTTLARDAMLSQKNTDVVCVYCAIGRRRVETWSIADALRSAGGRWVVVSAPEDTSAGLRYLAPYAATAVAEHFTYRGEHALVVYDDLSSHAIAWREVSLLLRRPPGREAYPGDVFYLHARLLERAAQLSPELGGGSLTALPIATLEGGRLSGYIPTNLVSITDGQIVLNQALFAAGQKPAIDVGTSVSRVGAKAQPQALRSLSGRLRLDYASFLELEAFSRLGTRLEDSTARRLALGERLRALLRGRPATPLGRFDEVVRLVLASDHELLLRLPTARVLDLVTDLATSARSALPHVAHAVETDGVLSESGQRALGELLVGSTAHLLAEGDRD